MLASTSTREILLATLESKVELAISLELLLTIPINVQVDYSLKYSLSKNGERVCCLPMRIKGSIPEMSCSERHPMRMTFDLKGILDMINPVVSPAIASIQIVALRLLAIVPSSSRKFSFEEFRMY
jgi:hypothetical protein